MTLLRTVSILVVLASPLDAQNQPRSLLADSVIRHEAINLLQGTDSAAFLDTERVQLVGRALRSIRQQLPELSDIGAGPDRTYLVLYAADSVKEPFVTRSGARPPPGAYSNFWTVRLTRVGIPAIDSLNRVFDVAQIEARHSTRFSALTLRFRRPANISLVAKSYARVPQVRAAGPPGYGGDGNRIKLSVEGDRLHFVFGRGSGDCLAGCSEWDLYYVTYDARDGTFALDKQLLNTHHGPD
jgi:hypothetical protein